ncbi:hypothetical protein CLV84_0699 [Neolewinella xylanilytica]|uniref:Uncharacterized protein n=1 Tax=Neolewinella xylanilytica TaxID=1514080 RepID=A0A2S6I8D4_9BACT|nr:hypothetical protein CLV84_0699 [Neolewinella xylanilytica]
MIAVYFANLLVGGALSVLTVKWKVENLKSLQPVIHIEKLIGFLACKQLVLEAYLLQKVAIVNQRFIS